MKYLKLYEEFVSSDTPVNYKKGEFEIKELFRILNSGDPSPQYTL